MRIPKLFKVNFKPMCTELHKSNKLVNKNDELYEDLEWDLSFNQYPSSKIPLNLLKKKDNSHRFRELKLKKKKKRCNEVSDSRRNSLEISKRKTFFIISEYPETCGGSDRLSSAMQKYI